MTRIGRKYKIYCDGEIIQEFEKEFERDVWLEKVKIKFPVRDFTKEANMEYKEKNHGITEKSITYLNICKERLGEIICAEGIWTEDDAPDYWTTFSDKDGNKIVCSGFSWGYYGEGPSGLQRVLEDFGFDFSVLDIANFGRLWRINK